MNRLLELTTPAGPGQVWKALTSPELTSRYLYGMAATSSWVAGAPVRLQGPGGTVVEGEVLAAAEPNRLSYSLQASPGQPSTYVTWEIWGDGNGSVVRLYVDEPDDLSADGLGPEVAAAWAQVLRGLESVLAGAPVSRSGPSVR